MNTSRFTRLGRELSLQVVEQLYSQAAYWARKSPRAKPARHGVEVIHDQRYDPSSSASDHLLDIYRPVERDGLLPVVMYIHGGGFRILSKDTHWIFGLGFARKGYVVFNTNYRLAPEHAFPAGPSDVCKAYAWIAQNAERFGGDPSQIIIAGESAGANLAAMLAIATCSKRDEPWAKAALDAPAPIAVMPSCGLHQVSEVGRFAERRKLPRVVTIELEQISIDYLARQTQGAEMADPLLLLEAGLAQARSLPPFLNTVGTRDPLLDDTRRLSRALEAMQVPCETRYYPGEGHAFQALVWRPAAKQWWGHSLKFMEAAVVAARARS
jgi:acetyl esterase